MCILHSPLQRSYLKVFCIQSTNVLCSNSDEKEKKCSKSDLLASKKNA